MKFEQIMPRIEEVIGYTFHDKALLRQAFTRKSYCNEARQRGDRGIQSNEVLEFCGDSVLSTAIITILMEKCSRRNEFGMITKLDEGDFTVIKSNLTNKSMLSRKMEEIGLAQHLLVGRGDAKTEIHRQPSVMEDLFESIVGAVYFDSDRNLPLIIDMIEKLLDTDEYLEKHAVRQAASPYNALQEFCQARGLAFSFEKTGQVGPEHQPTYTYTCLVDGKPIASGKGQSGAKAKAAAATAALPILEKKYK
ncbi:MAG: hypothetical protein IJ009_02760 [Clostridia bacterium]|nr:hypothetical protein [Clostridia bacterium]